MSNAAPDLTRLRQAVDASREVIFMTDRDGVFTFVNPQFERVYGYTAGDVIGRTTPRVLKGGGVPPEHYANLWSRLTRGESVEGAFVNRTKDGRLVDVEATVSPIWDEAGTIVGFMAIQRDVTARKAAEEQLRFQQTVLETERQLTLDGILVVDAHSRVLSFNRRLAEMWGVSSEILATRADDVLLEAVKTSLRDPEEFMRGVRRLYERHDEVSQDEVELVDDRVFERYSAPMRAADGQYYGRVWYFRDVTDRRRAERELRESQAQLQLVSDNVLDLVGQIRLDGSFVYVSPSYEAVMGYPAAALLGTSAFALVHAEDLERVEAVFADTVARGTSGRVEYRARRSDGTYLWLETVGRILRDGAGTPIGAVVSSRDITERKRSEEMLRQAQKLEAIGSLAGGIAHDFNNLLTAIGGYAELALASMGPDDPVRRDVEEIARAGQSAESLTRQLLIFSRKNIVRPVRLRLNDIVARIDKILRRMIGEHVEFEVALGGDLGFVEADPGQLEQVLMNLVVNARDAMPMGGRVRIETGLALLDASFARAHGGTATGAFNRLAVADTGSGMTPEVQSHIFDPFFTTKGPEKGTGLGLATVYAIVQQAGGYIAVGSAPGRGSTFTVYLPQAAGPGDAEAAVEAAAAPAGGRETILFVEDDPAIRNMAVRALQRRGYSVLGARDAEEALNEARHAGRTLDLLITDIVMPGMNGRALAERLRQWRADLKVVYTSGFTDDTELLQGIRSGETPFVQKPYTMDALARTVRRVLDQS